MVRGLSVVVATTIIQQIQGWRGWGNERLGSYHHGYGIVMSYRVRSDDDSLLYSIQMMEEFQCDELGR